jgi:hypothetical protein
LSTLPPNRSAILSEEICKIRAHGFKLSGPPPRPIPKSRKGDDARSSTCAKLPDRSTVGYWLQRIQSSSTESIQRREASSRWTSPHWSQRKDIRSLAKDKETGRTLPERTRLAHHAREAISSLRESRRFCRRRRCHALPRRKRKTWATTVPTAHDSCISVCSATVPGTFGPTHAQRSARWQ